jgi:hypothetical protein
MAADLVTGGGGRNNMLDPVAKLIRRCPPTADPVRSNSQSQIRPPELWIRPPEL